MVSCMIDVNTLITSASQADLTAMHRVTRRGCQELARTLFGVDISLGSVCKLHEEVSQALESCCEEIKQALPKQDVLNVDETGWKSMGKGIWLWVFVAPAMTFFTLAASRGGKVLKGVLGEVFNGIIVRICSRPTTHTTRGADRFAGHTSSGTSEGSNMFAGVPMACGSHGGCSRRSGACSRCGTPSKTGVWTGIRLSRSQFPLGRVMNRCLQAYELSTDPDVARAARGLLKHWNHLFTFLDHKGVEPTNNSAERGIRPRSSRGRSASGISPKKAKRSPPDY